MQPIVSGRAVRADARTRGPHPRRPWLPLLLLAAASCAAHPSGGSATHGRAARAARASATDAPAARVPEAPRRQVRRFERFELAFGLGGDVSVHPDDVVVRARFTAPSGATVTVGGFAARGRYRVRFTPQEVGAYRYAVAADAGAGEREVATGAFLSVPGPRRGFVRVDPRQPQRLGFDDGTPFWVLGENRINIYDPSWNHQRMGIEEYVAYMARNGMTTLRVFTFADAEAEDRPDRVQLGCLEPRVGRFDEAAAEQFDRILEAAEAHGIYVILTAYAIGFTPGEDTWKSWADNPYSAARGGPAAQPQDFFARPELRRHASRKLRYIRDRWGYSTHLLAVDLLNEPEWDGPVGEDTWRPWAEALAAEWHAEDPYGHLVTAGPVGLHWNIDGDERAWYASPHNSMVQWHLYGPRYYNVHNLADAMTRKVGETWQYGRPVVCGEFAWGGEDKATYDHTHVGIWSLAMSGAGAIAHSAPVFTVDCDEPMTPERGRHFRVLADFLAGLDTRGRLEPRRDVVAHTPRLGVWSLRSAAGDDRALWLLGPRRGYGRAVSGARLTIPDLPAGRYRLEWIDDVTGALVAAADVTSPGGGVTVAVPSFVRHLAGRLRPAR